MERKTKAKTIRQRDREQRTERYNIYEVVGIERERKEGERNRERQIRK